MNQVKIMWLSSRAFSSIPIKATATWLQPLAERLTADGRFKIINVVEGNVKETVENNFGNISQFLLPVSQNKDSLQIPSKKLCDELKSLVNKINPDIIHIWGTESNWAYMNTLGLFASQKVLLDIQGLLSIYYYYYYGGLTPKEVRRSTYIKEILIPKASLRYNSELYRRKGIVETESLKSFKHISCQSEWVRDQLELMKLKANLYDTKIMLRKDFMDAPKWEYHFDGSNPIVFSMCAAPFPYKGIHMLLRSIYELKRHFPKIKLRFAGNIMVGNHIMNGYPRYLKKLTKELDIENNVEFIGPLSSKELACEIQKSDVVVIPSFIETYCLAFAESMMIGAPTVAAFSGAMPNLAVDGKEALFYSPGDFKLCAAKIKRILENKSLACNLSQACRLRREKENNPEEVIRTQIDIYEKILNSDE